MTGRVLCFVTLAFWAIPWAQAQTNTPDAGPIRVEIKRADKPDDSGSPYRPVRLTVHYDRPGSDSARKVIRAIAVRSVMGGPTMLVKPTIPPNAPPTEVDMRLPAMSTEDSYSLRFLAGRTVDSDLIAETNVSLNWPEDAVTVDAFLDPDAYDEGNYLPPVWSARTRRIVFVVAAAASLLLAITLFVKHSYWRSASATATLVLAGVCLWWAAAGEPVIVRSPVGSDGRLLLAGSLRDGKCELEHHIIPLYFDMSEMLQDRAVVVTPDKLTVEIRTGQVLLFARPSAPERVNGATTKASGL